MPRMANRHLPPLYLVTNRLQTSDRLLFDVVREALEAGIRLIQLRERDLDTRALVSLGSEILSAVRGYNDAALLINDRIDVAMAIGADGVHLRSDSMPVQEARRVLGSHFLIGVSTHSAQEVEEAENSGADFVVLGPVFETPSKRSYGPAIGLQSLREASQKSQLPLFAIGGMTSDRVFDIRSAGAYGVAAMSAILEADSVHAATSRFLQVLQ